MSPSVNTTQLIRALSGARTQTIEEDVLTMGPSTLLRYRILSRGKRACKSSKRLTLLRSCALVSHCLGFDAPAQRGVTCFPAGKFSLMLNFCLLVFRSFSPD